MQKIGRRVRFIGHQKPQGWFEVGNQNQNDLPKVGQLGIFVAEQAPRLIRNSKETSDEQNRLDEEYKQNHVMIKWDECVYAWHCAWSDFEFVNSKENNND